MSANGMAEFMTKLTEIGDSPCEEITTFEILLIDRSGSMGSHLRVVETALEEHLKSLRECPVANRILMSALSFATRSSLDIPPTCAKDLPKRFPYRPGGNTRLYGTVSEVLQCLLRFDEDLQRSGRTRRFIVTAITDGGDNPHDEQARITLNRLAHHAQRREFELRLFGLGVNAEFIAGSMGFPTDADHAIQLQKTDRGIRETFMHISRSTIATASMRGLCPASPPPSSS